MRQQSALSLLDVISQADFSSNHMRLLRQKEYHASGKIRHLFQKSPALQGMVCWLGDGPNIIHNLDEMVNRK